MRLPDHDTVEVGGMRRLSRLRPARSDGKGNISAPPPVKLPGNLIMVERATLVAHMAHEAQRLYPELYVYKILACMCQVFSSAFSAQRR